MLIAPLRLRRCRRQKTERNDSVERGFKSRAEKKAVWARSLCGLPQNARLAARQLAARLRIPILGPREIPGLPPEVLAKLLSDFSSCWSAATLVLKNGFLIIYNTAHTLQRQESDLMHEIAHVLCEHKPVLIEPPGKLPWASRTFSSEQEEEAIWLGGCLQIPRIGLLEAVQRGLSNSSIASLFGASEEMVRYRRNTTGVDKQLHRRSRPMVSSR
jgi:IrrE N-terminal-like domain